MKYFTPARYLAFDNHDDEKAFLAAHEEWEAAIAAYGAHLNTIKPKLQPKLRKLIERVYLHDARVLSMTQRENDFVVTLQPATLPDRLVVLLYSLVEEPQIQTGMLPPDRCREPIEWLYDELDLDRPEGPRGLPAAESAKPTFRHNVLLSNGWEVSLRFRWVGVNMPLRVIPVRPIQPVSQQSA
jgi:hypothetical protein